MAKKDKDEALFEEEKEKDSGGNRVLTIITTIVIIIIWLAVFALLIRFDVGGFGSGVLRPLLKDINIVNKILPPASDDELVEENEMLYTNLEDANARIVELEGMLQTGGADGLTKDEQLAELQKEIDRLKVFEENQLEFEKQKEKFEKEVVLGENAPDLEAYKEYYESIDPANAEEIYRQVIKQIQIDEETKRMAERYAAMKPAEAAAVLEIMTGDLDLVTDILKAMKPKQSAAIIAKMEVNMAARVTKKMSVIEE